MESIQSQTQQQQKPNFVLQYSPRTQYSKLIEKNDILYNELKLNFDPITIKIIKKHFKERLGMLKKEEFIAILKNHLLAFIPNHPERERLMIQLLSRLFSDIDLNDNGTLEWNEFTNYIIHSSNSKDKTQNNKEYRLKFYSPAKNTIKPSELTELVSYALYLEKFNMIGIVQEGKSQVLFFDAKKCTKLKCHIDLQDVQAQVDEMEFSELDRLAELQLEREEETKKKKRNQLLNSKGYGNNNKTDNQTTISDDNNTKDKGKEKDKEKEKKKKKKSDNDNKPKKILLNSKDDMIKPSYNKKLSILSTCFVNEYDVLLIAGTNNTITAWQYNNGEFKNVNGVNDYKLIKEEFKCSILFAESPQLTMIWDPQLKYLFTGQKDGKILKWDLTKSKDIIEDRLDLSKIKQRDSFTSNKSGLKNIEKEQSKKLREQLKQKSNRKRIQGEANSDGGDRNETVSCLILLSKLQLLAASYYNGFLILWDTLLKDYRKIYSDQTTGIYSMAFDSTKNLIFTCGFDHDIYVYDPYIDNSSVYKLTGHSWSINSIDVNEKESEMISLDILGNIKLWDSHLLANFQTIKLNETFEDNMKKSHSLENSKKQKLSSNIKMLYIAKLKKILIYGSKLLFFETDRNNFPELADDQVICACYFDKLSKSLLSFCLRKITIWNILTGKIRHIYDDPMNNEITALIVDRNVKRAFLGDNTGKISNINLKNGTLIKDLTSHGTEIKFLCHSMALNIVASCSIDNLIKIHDDKELLDTEVIKELSIFQFQVRALCILNRFARLCIGLSNGTIKFYDIEHFHYDSDLGNDTVANKDEVSALAPVEDVELVFAGYSSGTCKLIVAPPSAAKFVSIYEFNISEKSKPVAISSVEFDNIRHWIFIGDMLGKIKCYDMRSVYEIVESIKTNEHRNLDNETVITKENYESFFNVAMTNLWSVEAHKESIKYMHFVDIEPRILITTSHDLRIKIFSADDGKYKDEFKQMSNRSHPFPIGIKYYLLDPFNNPNTGNSNNNNLNSQDEYSDSESNKDNYNSNKPKEEMYYISRKDIAQFSPAATNEADCQQISEYSKKISEFNAKEKLWQNCKNPYLPENYSNNWKLDINIEQVMKNEEEEYLELYSLVKDAEKITKETEMILQEKSLYSESYKPKYIEEMTNIEDLKAFGKVISERLRNVKLAVSKANLNQSKMSELNKKKPMHKSQSALALEIHKTVLPPIKEVGEVDAGLLKKRLLPLKKKIVSKYAVMNYNRVSNPSDAFAKYKQDFQIGFKEIFHPLKGLIKKVRVRRLTIGENVDTELEEEKKKVMLMNEAELKRLEQM